MKENYKELIEAWFASCTSVEETAELYADILHEIKTQLYYCIRELNS